MADYAKVKTPAKRITTEKHGLSKIVLDTMNTISSIVGSTLGPGGRLVIIERPETGLANIITKDGVTVFKALGFSDPTQHAIMEAARDAATKTGVDAGDGTTTATILSEAIVRRTDEFCKRNPQVSPQLAVRTMETVFKETIAPTVKKLSIKATKKMLHAVAGVSANGDTELADAVLKCFDLVGDDGNVTISELSGPSEYKVEKIQGYPIPKGYDESCGKFYSAFINDKANQRVFLEKPLFLLYHGVINDLHALVGATGEAYNSWQQKNTSPNMVIVATGFSEYVLATLAGSFNDINAMKIVPLTVPLSPLHNGQREFLEDIAVITGATVFDMLSNPLPAPNEDIDLNHFGYGVQSFEMQRAKSTIVGFSDEESVFERADTLKVQAKSSNSLLDQSIIEERIGKLTGGIAKLTVVGSSYGEIREKKDRAEDAVRAVQGAIAHGCLPAGGWTLLSIGNILCKKYEGDKIVEEILVPALQEPVYRLLSNIGFNEADAEKLFSEMLVDVKGVAPKQAIIFDALHRKKVNAVESGLLDSTPAVLEAIRNSLSIATLLGTLGGCVVYHRDLELERRESQDTNAFLRASSVDTE